MGHRALHVGLRLASLILTLHCATSVEKMNLYKTEFANLVQTTAHVPFSQNASAVLTSMIYQLKPVFRNVKNWSSTGTIWNFAGNEPNLLYLNILLILCRIHQSSWERESFLSSTWTWLQWKFIISSVFKQMPRLKYYWKRIHKSKRWRLKFALCICLPLK